MNVLKVTALSDALEKLNLGYKPMAGCTNILVDINKLGDNGKAYVSVQGLDELKGVNVENGLTLGALTTFAELENALKSNENYKAFYDCAYFMGSPQIRNTATIGGNIADASPACDFAPALLAFDGVITATSVDGERQIKAVDFFKGVRKTALKDNELITKITVKNTNGKSCFKKVGLRNALTISVVSLSALKENGKVSLAMGSVAPTPVRLTNVEKYINSASKMCVEDIKVELEKDISPITDVRATREYRLAVALNLLVQTLKGELEYDL